MGLAGADPDLMDNQLPEFDPNVIGATGLRHAGGMVDEEYIADLRGLRGRRTLQEMSDQCPTCGALLYAMSALFRSVKWSVQAADDSSKAEKGAQFLEEVLDDMDVSLDSVMTEVATMFTFGFAAHEVLWKRRVGPKETDPTKRSRFKDNKIGIRGLPMRAQTTIYKWEIDTATGQILGVWQQPYDRAQVFIPMGKLLLFRTTDARNNPEGRSLLRNAYRPWFFKRRIEEIEAIGTERDLAGLPVAYLPSRYMAPDADPAEKRVYRNYLALVQNLRADSKQGVVMPSDTDAKGNKLFALELMSTAGSRVMDTSKILDRYDRQIATSVLADFIFLGQGSTGSFALSSDKTALFGQALGAFLSAVAAVFNRKLIPALWELNDMDEATMPKMVFEDVERPNLGELASFVTSLASAGAPMFPDRELENHLREAGGLPPAPEEGSEDYDLRQGAMPGMTLGPDGKPIPSAAREDAKEGSQFNAKQPPGMPPTARWAPASGQPGAEGEPPADDTDNDANGVADKQE